jgi:CheY-like chemotaxis protein
MRRYLFVDDNVAFAENLAEIAADGGDACELAESAAEAVARLTRTRFDAVVTDMRMPGAGGTALLQAIRRVDPGLPVVILTAHAGDADMAAARREWPLDVLSKPAPIERLLALLRAARRHAVVAVLEDELAPPAGVVEALRQRGFATVTAGAILGVDRPGAVEPFAALALLHPGDDAHGEAVRRLEATFPGVALLRFSSPPDVATLLEAIERIHAERMPPA